MKKIGLHIVFMLQTTSVVCQDTTFISVTRKLEDSSKSQSEQEFSEEITNGFFSYLPWWNVQVINGRTVLVSETGLAAVAGLEYDLSKEETAHFYELGMDFGNPKLVVGSSMRLPSHSPDSEDGRGMQVSFRAFRKFEFRAISKFRLKLVDAPKANFQTGIEYVLDSKKLDLAESSAVEKRRNYISPFVGFFHPAFKKLDFGIKYRRNINLNSSDVHYGAIALQCNVRLG